MFVKKSCKTDLHFLPKYAFRNYPVLFCMTICIVNIRICIGNICVNLILLALGRFVVDTAVFSAFDLFLLSKRHCVARQ